MKVGRTLGWQLTLGTAVVGALAAGALSPYVLRAAFAHGKPALRTTSRARRFRVHHSPAQRS